MTKIFQRLEGAKGAVSELKAGETLQPVLAELLGGLIKDWMADYTDVSATQTGEDPSFLKKRHDDATKDVFNNLLADLGVTREELEAWGIDLSYLPR